MKVFLPLGFPVLTRGAATLLDSPPAPLCGAFPWHILERGDRGAVLMAVARSPPQIGCSADAPASVCASLFSHLWAHAHVLTCLNFYYEDGNKNFPFFWF